MAVLTLDIKGIILAFVLAFAMFFIGYYSSEGPGLGIFFVVSMLYFLALAALVTEAGMTYKKDIKLYQKLRGLKNVLANGIGPLIFVVVVFLFAKQGLFVALMVGFIGSVAAVTSDKFSSEIGVLNGSPTSIVTLNKVKKGVSGGVTELGLTAGLLGSFLISVVLVMGFILWFLPAISGAQTSGGTVCIGACGLNPIVIMVIIATFGGFVGTLVDSLLGYYEEKGIGNKYTSNFICSMAGGLLCVALYLLIFGV